VAGHFDTLRLKHLHRFTVEDVEFDQGSAAHAVDKQQNFIASLKRQVLDDRGEQHFGHLVGGFQLHADASRLAVDADANFHLIFRQVKGGFANMRDNTGSERHAHAAALSVDFARQVGNFLKRAAFFGGGANNLFHQHSQANAASSSGPGAVLYSHIVIHDD